jgi:hypothetical protein
MSVGTGVRKAVALTLSMMLAGPGMAWADDDNASQEEKQERRRRQEEKQQQREQARQQEQEQRQQERQERANNREQREQQEREQRQREREERVQRQEQRRQEADQERSNAQRQREEAQLENQRRQQQSEQQESARRNEERQRRREEQQRQLEEQQRREREQQAEQERLRLAEQDRLNRQAEQERLNRQPAIERGQRQQEIQSRRARPDGRTFEGAPRVSDARGQQVIRETRARSERYYQGWDQRDRRAQSYALGLQRSQRAAAYRYQQRYYGGLRDQWRRYDQDVRYYDYQGDPYFWSAPDYRYRYSGRWYETSQYGVDFLEDAVNRGYQEGFQAGQADRQDGWGRGYRDSYAYQDATYGYRGFYVPEDQYQYYFRQGFERGYQDGYHSQYEYGHRTSTGLKIAAAVLAGILIFEALR